MSSEAQWERAKVEYFDFLNPEPEECGECEGLGTIIDFLEIIKCEECGGFGHTLKR